MSEDPELEAMAKVLSSLTNLDSLAQARVLKWVSQKLNLPPDTRPADQGPAGGARLTSDAAIVFLDFADLFDATRPSTDAEKALVAGYWEQCGQGKADFGSQSLNDQLKRLGHPVGNITRALSALMNTRPALVQQLRKDGATKQARKTYRLTSAGQRKVEQMRGETPATTTSLD